MIHQFHSLLRFSSIQLPRVQSSSISIPHLRPSPATLLSSHLLVARFCAPSSLRSPALYFCVTESLLHRVHKLIPSPYHFPNLLVSIDTLAHTQSQQPGYPPPNTHQHHLPQLTNTLRQVYRNIVDSFSHRTESLSFCKAPQPTQPTYAHAHSNHPGPHSANHQLSSTPLYRTVPSSATRSSPFIMPAFTILRPHLSRKKDVRRDSTGSNLQGGIRAASARLRKAASLHSNVSPKKSKLHDPNHLPTESAEMQRIRQELAASKHDDRTCSSDRESTNREKTGFGLFKNNRPESSYARLTANKDQSFAKLKCDASFGRLSLRSRGRSRSRDRRGGEVPSKYSSARDIRELGRSAFTPQKMKSTPISEARLDDTSSEGPNSFGPSSFGVHSECASHSFDTRSEGPRSLQPFRSTRFRRNNVRPSPTPIREANESESNATTPNGRDVQLVPVLRRLAPASELCEHCKSPWPSTRQVWMSPSGDFHIADGEDESDTRVLRYDKFRSELGFCIAFWVIARPERKLDAEAARRWGLLGGLMEPLGGFVIRLFLADRNEHGFVAGTYYASADVNRGGYKPIALHALSLESLRVILTWARHVKDESRAPRFPEVPQLTAPVALDIIDKFCTDNRGTVLGPPPRSAM